MPKPDHCEGCDRKEIDWGNLNGVHLKYCRRCRRYFCKEHCFGIDYCIVCEARDET